MAAVSNAGDGWTGRAVATARDRWRVRLPLPCYLCGRPVDGRTPWVVEHDPPRWLTRARGMRVDASSEAGVSHRTCSDASGGRTAGQLRATAGRPTAQLERKRVRW